MPRRRTSNKPLKRRIKLNTTQDVQSEMGKTYRSVDRGDMTPADGSKRIFMLDKLLSSGLPDARALRGGGYVAPAISILSVPSGCFLTTEQIEKQRQGLPIIDIEQCKPLQLDAPDVPAMETSAPVHVEINTAPIVPYPRPRLVESPDDGDHAA